MTRRPLIIAVDGPAAAGKGTLARGLARHFGLPHLDTGLLYRATAARLLDAGGDPCDAAAAEAAARSLAAADTARGDLRRPAVDAASSVVSAHALVRAALLDFQRRFGREGAGAVLDGRDIGTVVFPDATAKLFVTADLQARAERRWRERRARGEAVELAAVRAEMAERDARDAARDAAPLRAAEDAVVLDTTALDAAAALRAAVEVVDRVLAGARKASVLGYDALVGPLSEEDGGGWFVTVPMLPGCMADGETPDEALRDAEGAVRAWAEAAADSGVTVPGPVTGPRGVA